MTRNDGPRFWVAAGDDEVPCVLRGRLRKEQTRTSSHVVVGDQVELELLPDGSGVIEARLPRRSELSRPAFGGILHVMAANVDQVVIVQAALQPRFKLGLVERFLATAQRGNMGAVVVVNKCDLEQEATIRSWISPLAAVDVPVVLTSAVDGRGLNELRDLLQGQISVLAGQSGVGKSSLLNALYPEAAARTTSVSWSSKGRHTTTSSRLYALPGGGFLVDTPGIRELQLFEDDADAVSGVFPEIESLAPGCRFSDCSHSHEPRCSVRSAVERGEVDRERYERYLRLRRGQ